MQDRDRRKHIHRCRWDNDDGHSLIHSHAKSLSGSFWRLISSISGLCWANRSQNASGGSFETFLGSAGQIALSQPLATHFKHFRDQLAQSLSEGLLKVVLRISGQIAYRKLLETHFKHFWAQLAKSLSGGLWKVIFNISGVGWPNRSQDGSGG